MNSLLGATLSSTGVEFNVWAPVAGKVSVIVDASASFAAQCVAMNKSEGGIFSASIPGLGAGARYRFRLDEKGDYPDPYSRFQPDGPHEPSLVVDMQKYRWHDAEWRGIDLKGQVIYELHVGTFTTEGTFDAAAEKLEHLRSVGITLIEIMPIAEFPGRWNWGYDGVNLFAPYHGYGDYEAFKRFVDRAHQLRIAVILDVVYNHLGPDGNYIPCFNPQYFSAVHSNDWGTPFNVDGEHSARVRALILDNACEWVREFHLDGLRLDATSNIPDSSEKHILREITERVRIAAGDRKVVVIAEDEQQYSSRLLPADGGGFGIDAMWNDDFHHTAYVAMTGRRHAYFYDYKGSPQEFISAVKRGFLYQGQYYQWQRQPRGQRMYTPAWSCVTFVDNHDQVANSMRGVRVHQLTSAARYRAMMTLVLLGPQTPMLFMGQEFNATTPFFYFADHSGDLSNSVKRGRAEFLRQFSSIDTREAQAELIDPADESLFPRSKLDWQQAIANRDALEFTTHLLALRKSDPVISAQDATRIDGAMLAEHAFVIRWFDDEHGDRLLLVNFSTDQWLDPGPEPLLAPSLECCWSLLWSSERTQYGGFGMEHPETERGWYLAGETAVLLCETPLTTYRPQR